MPRINAVSFHELGGIETICRAVKQAGFDSFEVSRPPFFHKLTTSAMRRTFLAWLKQQGLTAFGFDAWVDVQPYSARGATLEAFKSAIDFAGDLDLGLIVTHDGWKRDAGHRRRSQCLPVLTRYFKRLCDMAAQRGLDVVIEPHPDTLSMDASFAIDLIDSVRRDNFGLLFDCAHYGVGHPHSYVRIIEKLGVRIKHVHFSDGDRRTYALHLPLGEGELDLRGIVQALKDLRFKGTLTNDLYNYPLLEDGARRNAEKIRAVEHDLGLSRL